MKTLFRDFISLFYPNYCTICGNTLRKNEDCICMQCMFYLPKTNFHLQKGNPLEMLFYGKVPIEAVSAFYYFKKGNITQTLIHQLKYRGCKEIGFLCGYLFGLDLKKSDVFISVDVIMPIPLYPKKQKKRGYNQSEEIAKGLAKALQKKLNSKSLVRVIETETQTKKTLFERWENTQDIFNIQYPEQITSKHILLVDDVITTGSTLESACNTSKVSVACLACTSF